MKKILVVTKDIAEFGVYRPVVTLLRELAHTVTVVAEGLSLSKWLESGEDVYGGKPADEYWDKVNGFRFDIDPQAVFSELNPDLVLAGLGGPINLGQTFSVAASKVGIKLGYVNDLWGAETRSPAVPDFICTLDPLGQKLIRDNLNYQAKMPKIYITGSPLMDRLATLKRNVAFNHHLDVFRQVVFLLGQDECTTPVVEGLMEALPRFGRDTVLIPRLHPKLLDKDYVMDWLQRMTKAPVTIMWVPAEVSTQEIMMRAHYTVSVFSNGLMEAAILGSLPVSWTSDIGRQKMGVGMGGLNQYPLVSYGCAVEVGSSEEFLTKVPPVVTDDYSELVSRCKHVLPNDGKSAYRVVEAIQAELG